MDILPYFHHGFLNLSQKSFYKPNRKHFMKQKSIRDVLKRIIPPSGGNVKNLLFHISLRHFPHLRSRRLYNPPSSTWHCFFTFGNICSVHRGAIGLSTPRGVCSGDWSVFLCRLLKCLDKYQNYSLLWGLIYGPLQCPAHEWFHMNQLCKLIQKARRRKSGFCDILSGAKIRLTCTMGSSLVVWLQLLPPVLAGLCPSYPHLKKIDLYSSNVFYYQLSSVGWSRIS